MFGWFGKKKSSTPPQTTTPPPSKEGAPAPGPGEIVAFSPADAVGTIRLDAGGELRFGQSACVEGLLPVLGVRVQVREVAPHPRGGWRATSVAVAPGEAARAAALIDAHDRAAGLTPASTADAAGLAMQLGALTVLLREAPPPGRPGLLALHAAAGLGELGISLELGVPTSLRCGSANVEVDLGTEPLPHEQLDLRFDPQRAHLGKAFLTLRSGLPGMGTHLRLATGRGPDAWAEQGTARFMTRVASRLVERGLATGVVVHRAGHVVRPASSFAPLAFGADDLSYRPLGAWLDLGLRDGKLASYGMDAFWLPDVAAPEAHPHLHGPEGYARAHEAVMLACYRMVRENRALAVGEELAVPLGVEVGASPLEQDNPGLDLAGAPRWRVRALEERLELEPVAPIPSLAQLWSEGRLPYTGYRALLLAQVEADGCNREARMSFPELGPEVPPHEVFVYARPDGRFSTFTCGLGRVGQPNGSDETDDLHIELMLTLHGHRPQVASVLSQLGSMLHLRGPDAPPIGPEHRLMLGEPLPPLNIEYVVMAWGGALELAPGPGVSLFVPLIMTAEEKARVPGHALSDWLRTDGSRPEVLGRWLPQA